jgi:hypothetical protein
VVRELHGESTTTMSYRPEDPSDEDNIRAWIERYLRNVHTALPGRVESYDAETQRANVLPTVRHEVPQSDGSSVYEDLPVCPSVPVLFPRAGDWFLSFPVNPGDTGLLVFCEANPAYWETGDGAPAYPGDLARHALSFATFIPGYSIDSNRLERSSTNLPSGARSGLILGRDTDSGSRISIRPTGEVVIMQGSTVVFRVDPTGTVHCAAETGADFVALAAPVKTILDALKAIFTAWTPVPGDGGAALKAALASWTVGALKAEKTKAT